MSIKFFFFFFWHLKLLKEPFLIILLIFSLLQSRRRDDLIKRCKNYFLTVTRILLSEKYVARTWAFFYLYVTIFCRKFDIMYWLYLPVHASRLWSTSSSTLRTYIVFECSLSKLFKLFFCVVFHSPKLAASSWICSLKKLKKILFL